TDGSLYSEALYGFTIAVAMLVAYRLIDRPRLRNAALLGAACGFATLTRGEALFLVPVLALPIIWRMPLTRVVRGRWLALTCVLFALVLAPWVVRSWIVFDQPVGI